MDGFDVQDLISRWLIYTVTLAALSITPGPMNLLSIYNGIAYGWRATQWAVLGGLCGVLVILAVSFFGISAIIMENDWLNQGVRILGIGYLIYIGLRVVLYGNRHAKLSPQIGQVHFASSPPARFKEMFLLALLSPGDLIFFGSLFPTLIDLSQSLILQFVLFAGTYLVIDYTIMSSHAVLGKFVLRWMTPRRLRAFNLGSGAILLAMAMVLIAINFGGGVASIVGG